MKTTRTTTKTKKTPAVESTQPQSRPDRTQCDHLAFAGPLWTRCERCGSTCTRVKGVIDTYTRGTNDMPKTSPTAKELTKLAAAN